MILQDREFNRKKIVQQNLECHEQTQDTHSLQLENKE